MKILRKLFQWIFSLDDESDFFRPMKWFFVIGGIHLESQNRLYRALFALHRFQLAIQIFVWADRGFVALFDENSPVERIEVTPFFIAIAMIVIRAGLIWFYLRELQAFRFYMSGQLNRFARNKRRDRSYRLLRGISLVVQVTFVVDQILFFAFGVFTDPLYTTPDNLGLLGRNVQLFITVINANSNLMMSSLYATILTVLNSVLMGLQVELDEIVTCYRNLFQRVDQRVHNDPANREKDEQLLFWRHLKAELKTTIIRHNNFLEQLEKLSGFFKLSFLVMFYMEIVIHASAIYYMRMKGLTMNTFITFCYITSIVLECYWFCWLAEKLNSANAEIGTALYGLEWPERLRYDSTTQKDYREVRTALLMIMVKVQRNLGINSGGLFEMSIEAFGTLVQLIYNFLMFLINTAQ